MQSICSCPLQSLQHNGLWIVNTTNMNDIRRDAHEMKQNKKQSRGSRSHGIFMIMTIVFFLSLVMLLFFLTYCYIQELTEKERDLVRHTAQRSTVSLIILWRKRCQTHFLFVWQPCHKIKCRRRVDYESIDSVWMILLLILLFRTMEPSIVLWIWCVYVGVAFFFFQHRDWNVGSAILLVGM